MRIPQIPLSPMARKLLAAASLVAGVFVVGGQLKGSVARDVELRVRLGAYSDASIPVRSVDVTFLRDDAPLRAFRRNFSGSAPRELRESVSLPEGALRARVTLTLDHQAVERESYVTITPGGTIELPTPPPP
ncbi:MAG: hypothetical protein U0326_43600 [Polyangiales bacterium]